MKITYSDKLNENDWRYVLDNAAFANVFHTIEYAQLQCHDGHKILFACCYDQNRPTGIIVGYLNRTGYHRGFIEVGTKSGGWPLMIDDYDQEENADEIKNDFIRYFADTFIQNEKFFFYPCFHMKECIFEQPDMGCQKQYDQTVILDLSAGVDALWAGLNHKCRNVVRFAQKKNVIAKIANKIEFLELFYSHYRNLREHLNTQYMGFDEIKARFDLLTGENLADLWVAFSEDRPLAFAFIWKYRKTINFVYGSSDPSGLSLKPNNLIQWALIEHYTRLGYTLYNMWGVRNMNFSDAPEDDRQRKIEGYGKFKLSFGSRLKDLVRYYRM